MSTQYKLTYFNVMGLAEPARLILAYANVDYEDIRIDRKEQWPAIKPTTKWGKLPTLQLQDGTILSQSSAIMRYLARKYDLVGDTLEQSAKCDEYADTLVDLRQNEIVKHFNAPTPTVKAEIEKQLLETTFPRILGTFLNILKENGTGYLVGSRLTYADIFLAFMIGQIRKTVSQTYVNEKYPEIVEYEHRIMDTPGIKEWVAKRPVTIY